MQLFNEHGIDVLRGLGMNRDKAASEDAPIVYAGTNLHPVVNGESVLRLKISDQSVASAQLTITLYFALGY